jgi:hypothetical protein
MFTYKSDKPHEGIENILVAFDIGTTQSKLTSPLSSWNTGVSNGPFIPPASCERKGAVSFSYVYPGEHPEVRSVSEFSTFLAT